MKIIVITDLYPIYDAEKNTPRTIYDFVESWKNLGHDVIVIKPNFLFNSILRGKPIYQSKIFGNIENINYFLPFVGNIKNKIKSDLEADLIIAHMPSGLIFANKLGRPFVAAVHNSDIEVLTKPVYSVYFKQELEKAYKNASKIACRSFILQKKFLELYPHYADKTFVAYSGIDKNIITTRTWEKKDKYKILTCGKLIKRKNIDKVIKACSNINNVELTIAGEGRELCRLKQIADSNNFKVNFTGYLTHKKVLEKMRDSDIFLLPSENETFGMVYLEAMASGCITVGLKDDGIDGIIIDGQNGFLTNLESIQSTILNIINSDNQNEILQASFDTICNYTQEKAGMNYINNIL